jgi:predicted nucleotidyltransferase
VLRKLCAILDQVYGDRLARVALFGSRARGEARPDSDFDVAVFLRGPTDRWKEIERLATLATDLPVVDHAVIEALPFPEARYGDPTPLMGEIRRDGVDL